ncbi:MAG TPA: ABC transporter permease subunit [Aliidongia sp.]|uniref:ABC transporter permease n=1 Tax=Aliidongia sp. TaxID=1914230 RepID=UPI002DDCBC6C|nr:ABC transporter permease subunit [Aliidongia sp.]HEV2677066.1 ABC transporter permease subunit [Aliidongia sp.]
MTGKLRKPADFLLLMLALVVIWQALHWVAGDIAITSPAATLAKLGQMLHTPKFWSDIAETGRAFLFALLISVFGGVALGALLGINRLAATVSEPILVAAYSLPKVTLYPLVLLIFGLGLPAKVAFGAMHGLIPVTIVTMNALLNLKPVLLRTARVMRLSPLQSLTTLLLPAVLPEIFSGLRLGFSLSLVGVLIGEMFASQRGLGFVIMNAMNLSDVATIMAVAVLLTGFALLASGALGLIDRRIHR